MVRFFGASKHSPTSHLIAAVDFGLRRLGWCYGKVLENQARDVMQNIIDHGGEFVPEDDCLLNETSKETV